MKNKKYELLVDYIKENQDKFYRVAFSYTKSQEDALDIVQDTIYKALKSYRNIKNAEYIKTWFYRILINTSINYIKKSSKTINIDFAENIKDDSKIIGNEDVLDLYDALDKLNSEDKTLIILRFFEDLKFSDIAKVTGMNINSVKTKIYKIIKNLKLSLDSEVIDYEECK